MMRGNAALRVAITGANGNIRRKLIAAFLTAPDIAANHAIDRDVAGLSSDDSRLFSNSGESFSACRTAPPVRRSSRKTRGDHYLKHRRITRRPSIATSSGKLLSKASIGMFLKNDQ
jgi:hypothetical protein